MQKNIRRTDREIDSEETAGLMASGTYGVLATVDANQQPYAVPLSYVFHDNHLYFHCARIGHKVENIRANAAVSFCVVGATKVLPGAFSTEYESAVAFGTVQELQGEQKEQALLRILEKYSPDYLTEGRQYLAAQFERVAVFDMAIQRLTGKARR